MVPTIQAESRVTPDLLPHSSTSGVIHRVRLPRRRSPTSYSAQFFTLNFILGMWWRRGALCLFSIEEAAFRESPPDYPTSAPSVQQRPTGLRIIQRWT